VEKHNELVLIAYISLFIILVSVFLKKRVSHFGLTPLDFAFIFLFIQYGPHTVALTDSLRFQTELSSNQIQSYLFLQVSAISGLIVGLLVSPNSRSLSRLKIQSYANFESSPQFERLLVYFSVAYVVCFWLLQGIGLPILRENISYFIGSSQFSYTELRREVFAGTAYEEAANSLRHGVTALLFALNISFFLSTRRWKYLFVAIVVFFVCASQLNKFPYIYFLILLSLVAFAKRRSGYLSQRISFRLLFILLLSAGLFGGILYLLYSIQYRSAIESGLVIEEDIVSVLFYRIFLASSDGLRLWLEYFPDISPHIGLSNISIAAEFMGDNFRQPTIEVPQFFIGDRLTTMQAGFLGSTYASFGFFGVFLGSIFVVAILKMSSIYALSFKDPKARSAILSLLCLNTVFLGTRELHTALSSGGVLLAPICSFLFFFLWQSLRRLNPS
jgi:hypothetical protein